MPCIALDILERLSRVWSLCAGLQELINSSAVGRGVCCGKDHWQDRVGGRRKERVGRVFQVFYFLKVPS